MLPLSRTLARASARALMRLPSPVLRRLAGPPRIRVDDGVTLDLQTQVLLRAGEILGHTDGRIGDVRAGRRRMEEGAMMVDLFPSAAVHTREIGIPAEHGTIPARLYTPSGVTAPGPLVVYFHGGGWALGSLESHDGVCRSLATHAETRLLAVDYRLAPEHRYPAAVDDAIAAFRFVAENAARFDADPTRLAVAGDSAGGNLAAVTAFETRRDAVRPVFQLLIYPATDMTRSHASHRLFAEGYMLTKASMDFYLDTYAPDPACYREPRASPLFTGDCAGAPPAMVVTAGFDPLRDEGRALAERLREAGVPTEYVCAETLVHGFYSMAGVVDEARRVFDRSVQALRGAIARRA